MGRALGSGGNFSCCSPFFYFSEVNANGYDFIIQPVFEDLSIALDTDWHLGLTGRNGRGKTTLLRLLLGAQGEAYGLRGFTGSIQTKVRFGYFPAPVEHPEWLALEVAQQICPDCQQWQLERELSLLEFPEDALWRPFEQLSGGEKTKLQLAALFLQENAFPLIDEPTNHLDTESRQLVADYLKRQKGFLLVSHDRDFLDGCVDHILSLDRDGIQLRKGDFTGWYQDYQTRVQSEREQNERLKKEIGRLQTAARRTADWSGKVESSKIGEGPCDRGFIGHKAAKMMQRSKNIQSRREQAIRQKEELLKGVENTGKLKLQPVEHFAKTLLQARELSVCFDGRELFETISFAVRAGDKIALHGRNGCGKTSLLRLLMGEELPFCGQLERASGLRLSLVPQDASFLQGNLCDYLQECSIDQSRCLSILRNLGFEREQFDLPMQQYSQGQKKKVLIAKSLCEQAHLYLWDEPLNYIDIFSRIQLEQLVADFEGTMLFVEHDSAFCRAVATDTVNILRR